MRVIAGSARRLLLKTPKGNDTRPTQDRIKETLFNILQNDVPGAIFVDLFCGSGGIGIEALSRGAAHATFVDNSRKAVRVIEENLQFTKLADRAEVLCRDAALALRALSGRRSFDLIFLDPPYDKGLEKEILFLLPTLDLAAWDAITVVEASLATDFSYLAEAGYRLIKEKCYKNNRHLFLEYR